jgi:(p)ppGpp synthase/HD superfamily hydrolase
MTLQIPRWSPDVYAKAWRFASWFHAGQKYGGVTQGEQIEYINHIGSVAMEILAVAQLEPDFNADFAVQMALLHDTLEDTRATFADLETEFGIAVANGVQALTKSTQLPDKRAQMLDSLARIRLEPREVWMVKLADRITNLYHPPFYWNAEKIAAYKLEALLILEQLGSASTGLAHRLREKIRNYGENRISG